MINVANALMLVLEFTILASIVLGLFRLRGSIGLTPLYVTLGVFQPVQVILAATLYVELGRGYLVSPGSLMFAASLLALFVVYLREDALEARRFIYCVLGANLLMTLLLAASGARLEAPGVNNLLDVSPHLFNQGARVTTVGTLVLVADVLLMIAAYGAIRRLLPGAALLRAWLTLTLVLVFDGIAFTVGVFAASPELPSLLASAIVMKAAIGTLAALAAVVYLRFVERPADAAALPDLALRDIFYSLSYRDRYELQATRTAAVEAQLRSVFQRIGDAVVAIDLDGRYTFANDLACQFMGLPRESVVGTRASDLYGEGAPVLDWAIREAIRTQAPQVVDEFYEAQGVHFESRIYPSAEGVTIYFNDVTERNRQRDELRRRALTDEMTGLLNRRAFREAVDALAPGLPAGHSLGVVVLNLDRLRHVNNTLGYEAGDEILKEASRRLRDAAAAPRDVVARIGGDEFAFASARAGVEAMVELAESLVATIREPFQVRGEPVYLTCSAGVVWAPDAGTDAGRLLRSADLTLNAAKRQGGDHVARFSRERADRLGQRMAMTAELRAAAETPEVHLAFQPIVEPLRGAAVAAEALMRWTSPRLGSVSPIDFIPVAEDTGLIVDLGYLAIRRALLHVQRWRRHGYATVPVAVDVSPVQFRHERFLRDVIRALEETGSAPGALKLEITESAFIDDIPGAIDTMNQLRRMGVRISLDDFGTGYSSLGLLRQLPLDEVKIDRSLVEEATVSTRAGTLCRSVVAMCHELQFRVVAEGVETEAQAAFLREIGCDLLQGFHFSRPVAPEQLAELFLARTFAPGPGEGYPPA